MNRTHRVIWSQVRNCFVVASEKTKTKGKPASTVKAAASAVAMALAAMAAQPAMAAGPCDAHGTITISAASADTCFLGNGDTLIITGGSGSISGINPAVDVNGVAANSITNSGTISGSGGLTNIGIDIYNSGSLSNGILNNASSLIEGGHFGIHIVTGGTVSGGITNDGTITGASGGGIGILGNGSVSGGITNNTSGLITGGSYGIGMNASNLSGGVDNSGTISGGSYGVYFYSSSADSITNNAGGTISATGVSGTGIRIVTGSVVGSLANSGTITAAGLSGTGIRLINGTISGSLANSGTISGGGHSGIRISNSSSIGSLTNSGTISGAWDGIFLFGSSTIAGNLINSGLISGSDTAIRLNSGGAITGTLTNSGTISGDSHGLYLTVGSDIDSIDNGGTIQAISTTSGQNVYGIAIDGDQSSVGSLTNSGIISAQGSGSSVAAYGVHIGNSAIITGSLTNSGTISASISGGNSSMYAYGIYMASGTQVGGGITNSGTITADGSSNGTGIYAQGAVVTGGIVNSGTINTGLNAGRGILIQTTSTVNGAITNALNGTISAYGHGIEVSDSVINANGSNQAIYNAGVIQAQNAGWGDESAIRTSNATLNGDIVNVAGGTLSGWFNGLNLLNSTVDGDINNGGLISGSHLGIFLSNSTITGNLTNSGTIASTGSSSATAIYFSNSSFGSLTNSGTISGSSAAMFFNSSSATGGITNSGTIIGGWDGIMFLHSSADTIVNEAGGLIGGSANAGININSASSVNSITNSGTIAGAAYAINVSSFGGSLTTLDIDGNDTARFIGEVSAPDTDVTLLSGATYTMQGGEVFTLNGTSSGFTNNGTLGIAEGATGTITGDYTQAANATFRTAASSDANYGQLVVSGTATVAGNAFVDVNSVNTLASGQTLSSVISAGTLSGNFTGVTDNSALFNFTSVVNGNNIDFLIAQGMTVLQSVTNNGNTPGTGAAGVLDALLAGGSTGNADMDAILTQLGQLATEREVSDAVRQMLPSLRGQLSRAQLHTLRHLGRLIQARHEQHRGLSSGEGFVDNGKVWVKPLGSWANQNDRNAAFGYSAQTYGVALGADGEMSQSARLGGAFAYSHSNVDSNSGVQSAGVNSYQFVLYGSNSLDEATEFNWQADYGYNQNAGSRYIALVNRVAASSYNSDSVHVGAGVGHTMPLSEQTSFTPSMRADYTSMTDKGYTETGAGALNLVVGGRTTDELVLSVDGKLMHQLEGNASVTANLGLGYDVNAKQDAITASFAGGGAAFTTTGINPSATTLRGGLGYVGTTDSGVELSARYDLEARTGFTGQTASVKARWAF